MKPEIRIFVELQKQKAPIKTVGDMCIELKKKEVISLKNQQI